MTEKKKSTVNPRKKGTTEGKDHSDAVDKYDDKKAVKLPSRWKERVPFKKII